MPEHLRPDRAYFVVEHLGNVPVVLVVVDPKHKKDWLGCVTSNGEHQITRMLRAEYADRGVSVVATNGNAILADGHTAEDIREWVTARAKAMKAA